jgi:hypothetical protein
VSRSRAYLVLGLLVLGLPVAYWLGQARAAGPPATDPLFYSGFLTDTSNNPVSGNHTIVIRIYDAATMGNQLCITAPLGLTMVTGGRFRVPLDASCTTAVHANPDLWIEPSLDGMPFARTKLGAVPYALEAGAVQFANVGGIAKTTEWPGAISPDRVTGNQALVRDYPNPTPSPVTVLSAFINYGTSYSVGASNGPWVSSVTSSMSGQVTLNLATSYSVVNCTATSFVSVGHANIIGINSITGNSIDLTLFNTGAGAVDSPFEIICVAK